MSYDASGRLVSATGPWGTGGAQAAGSFVYDALGNLRSWTQGAKTGSPQYGDATNRVTSYVKTGEATRNFSYDSRGNVVDNGDNTFTYDYSNQPVSVGGPIPQTHQYDGNFRRVKSVENGKTVYQLFSRVTGGLIYRDEMTDGETTDYVSVGGAALRLKKVGATVTPEYSHFDHQGSAVAATDATGAVLWRERYSPWGTRLLKPAGNRGDTGYTGHLMDNTTELVYMQARYYDSQIGRFYSTDPIGYEDQLNLYAYVHNDPVNATDPNGEFAVLLANPFVRGAIGGAIGGAIAGGVNIAQQIATGEGSLGDRIGNVSLNQAGIAAAGGFATGALVASTGNLGALAVGGGVATGATTLAQDIESGAAAENPGKTAIKTLAATVIGGIAVPAGAQAGQLTSTVIDDVALGVAGESLTAAGIQSADGAIAAAQNIDVGGLMDQAADAFNAKPNLDDREY